MNHHPALYEEHDQATNSEVRIGQQHLRKHKPRFDSDDNSPWPSKSHLFHEEESDEDNVVRHHGDKVHHDNGYSDHDDDFDAHINTLLKEVQPRVDDKGSHHDISYEEANSIHGADSDDHPHEGEHPFTEHYPRSDDDIIEVHHSNLQPHDNDHHKEGHQGAQVVISKATNFKSHSGGVEEEVASIKDKETNQNHDSHPGDDHSIDQDTVAEITKNVVKAVMKAKYSKKSKVSKKGRNEIRKRTIHNLYVCECPPGFLGAHCQRKFSLS